MFAKAVQMLDSRSSDFPEAEQTFGNRIHSSIFLEPFFGSPISVVIFSHFLLIIEPPLTPTLSAR
jgi:hypothetical protein